MRERELALEAQTIQDVHDEINILMPPPSASAGGSTLSSNASTKRPGSRRTKAKPAVAVSPAVREMTGFTNVAELNVSLYLSFEELDALEKLRAGLDEGMQARDVALAACSSRRVRRRKITRQRRPW